MKLTRGQKTVRNLILCALLWALVYAMLGFPPYTVRGMLERVERQYLLSDLEPVLVERNSWHYSNYLFGWHSTYLIARTGNTFISTKFSRHALEVIPEYGRSLKMSRGALCMARNGTLYVAGDFTDAASASVEVTAEKTTRICDRETGEYEIITGEQKTFTFQGEKVSDELFSFYYRGEDGWSWTTEDASSLEGAAYHWYRTYIRGDSDGYSNAHAELPVKVTLFDGAGGVLGTLKLTIDTYELWSDW